MADQPSKGKQNDLVSKADVKSPSLDPPDQSWIVNSTPSFSPSEEDDASCHSRRIIVPVRDQTKSPQQVQPENDAPSKPPVRGARGKPSIHPDAISKIAENLRAILRDTGTGLPARSAQKCPTGSEHEGHSSELSEKHEVMAKSLGGPCNRTATIVSESTANVSGGFPSDHPQRSTVKSEETSLVAKPVHQSSDRSHVEAYPQRKSPARKTEDESTYHLGRNLGPEAVLSEVTALLKHRSSQVLNTFPADNVAHDHMRHHQQISEGVKAPVASDENRRNRRPSRHQLPRPSDRKGDHSATKKMVIGRDKTRQRRSGTETKSDAEINNDAEAQIRLKIQASPDDVTSGENDSDIASDLVDVEGDLRVRRQKEKPSDQVDLEDSKGVWVSPPDDWEDRYISSDQSIVKSCTQWQGSLVPFSGGIYSFKVPQEVLLRHEGNLCPLTWVPELIDGENPMIWMTEQIISMHEDDKHNQSSPFWRLYLGPKDERLHSYNVPEAKLDPNDNDMEKASKQTSDLVMRTRVLAIEKKQAKVNRYRKERQADLRQQKYGPAPVYDYSPKINMYLRPAEPRDLPQLKDIYNHWIVNSVFCPERAPLDMDSMQDRYESIVEVQLPFLVAADRSSKGNRRQVRRSGGEITQEHIIGFAFADDFMSAHGMYRYAVEVECFVRAEYLRMNVGRALMDKLMCSLDPDYLSLGGYDFIGDDILYKNGGKRILQSILIHMPHETGDKTKLTWCGSWIKQYGFRKAGLYVGMGRKLDKKVDLAVFLKKTGSNVPADAV